MFFDLKVKTFLLGGEWSEGGEGDGPNYKYQAYKTIKKERKKKFSNSEKLINSDRKKKNPAHSYSENHITFALTLSLPLKQFSGDMNKLDKEYRLLLERGTYCKM